MKKRILPFLLLLVMCFAALHPLCAQGATPLDPDAKASLTLHYQKDGAAFADLSIGIYRVAEAFADGSFELIEPFASYPINIHGITMQEQWQHVAQTLCSYMVANQQAPDQEAKTDANGTVCFSDLKTGLYFVREVVAENTAGTYVFNQFLVYVPTPQPDGSYDYAVEAKPKCTNFIPKTQYTVTKLWQDNGYQNARPSAVTVDIYKDGKLQESQILNASNNWSYVWYVSEEDHSQWTVVERSVSDAYTVTVQQNGGTFSIINTHKSTQETPDIPQTGDTTSLLPWIIVMCISGIMLTVIGIYGRRRRGV